MSDGPWGSRDGSTPTPPAPAQTSVPETRTPGAPRVDKGQSLPWAIGSTVLLGGLLMVVFGLLRLGKLIRMVPHSVMLGFVNGLAIIIALAQLEHFRDGEAWLSGSALYLMLGLVALTLGSLAAAWRFTDGNHRKRRLATEQSRLE